MLKSWSIQNFKAIVDSGDLKLAPVTILAGRNSSGKSSLLQSILMVAQTLSNQVQDRPLITNGTLVQLGTFEDVLSDLTNVYTMTIEFTIGYEGTVNGDETDATKNTVEYSNHQIKLTLSSNKNDEESVFIIDNAKVSVENISLTFDFSFWAETNSFSCHRASEEELKKALEDIPQTFLRLLPNLEDKSTYLGVFDYPDPNVEKVFVNLSHFLPDRLITKSIKDGRLVLERPAPLSSATFLTEAVEEITSFFVRDIRYLGPLRADPGFVGQTLSPTGEPDYVGSKGEYAAIVYQTNQQAIIDYYNPRSQQLEKTTLQEALDVWARHLEVAQEIRAELAGAAGVMWKVALKQGQQARPLPQVGVGVSQILPILVMGLLSPTDALLIIEQPELHLHPRVQARLGDFFMGLAKCSKQCLIETHSENLVSQLRYHIVQAGGQDKSDCIIYFVDQDEQGGAKFEQVKISERGNILNWPTGFFDETMHQEDKITTASIRRRAKLAKKNG